MTLPKTMYPGMVNSPETTITNNISESDTIIYVLDPARVPEPPNLMTLGTGTNAETVLVTEINDNAITVERGIQGVAKSWSAGTIIARNFTEYDYRALVENIEDLETSKETPAGAQAKADAAQAAAEEYADAAVEALAGPGNTKTVKQVADEVATHLAETVSKVVLVTEPYDQTTTTTVNLGFKPKWVSVKAIINGSKYWSDGVCTELSFQYCLSNYVFLGTYTLQGGSCVYLAYGTGQDIIGVISAINDTGIEISWTVKGTIPDIGTGQRRLLISAIAHGEE